MEKFKDELKDLKNILNAIKELEIFREQEINEIKNETKRELNMLYHEIYFIYSFIHNLFII